MALKLPQLSLTGDDDDDDFKWQQWCGRAMRDAKTNVVNRCAMPPAPLILQHTVLSEKNTAGRQSTSGTTSPPHVADLLSRSGSAPVLTIEKLRNEQRLTKQRESYRQHVAYTPAGLFLNTMQPTLVLGSETCGRYADAVASKDYQLKMRAVAANKRRAASSAAFSAANPDRKLADAVPAAGPATGFQTGRNAEEDRRRLHERKEFESCMFDIREGLRVLILGAHPSPLGTPKVWPPKGIRQYGKCEETLDVYKVYRDMVKDMPDDSVNSVAAAGVSFNAGSDGDGSLAPLPIPPGASFKKSSHSAMSQKGRGAELGLVSHGWSSTEGYLPPISWSLFFLWVEEKAGINEDPRRKYVCEGFLKALRHWRSHLANPTQRRYGVYLHMIMKWIWPGLKYKSIANMHCWLCNEEFQKICLPAPPVVGDDERRFLQSLFRTMDRGNKGYCTPLDLSGGECLSIQEQLKNTIDVVDCRGALGDVQLNLHQFMELMCTDYQRGHPDALRVCMPNGRGLIFTERPNVGLSGWVYQDTPENEKTQRKLIDSLEAEVVRWNRSVEDMGSPPGSPASPSGQPGQPAQW